MKYLIEALYGMIWAFRHYIVGFGGMGGVAREITGVGGKGEAIPGVGIQVTNFAARSG
jgi:hypothetical protein